MHGVKVQFYRHAHIWIQGVLGTNTLIKNVINRKLCSAFLMNRSSTMDRAWRALINTQEPSILAS